MTEPPSFTERRRASFTVRAEVLTWDLAAFRIRSLAEDRSIVACVAQPDVGHWLRRLDAGELDAELAERLRRPPRRTLRRTPRSLRREIAARPARLGLEHEWSLRRDGAPVDFRRVLPTLHIPAPAADPVDPNARRFGWGVLTADGAEAETAVEAVVLQPGFVAAAVDAAASARRELEAHLPAELEVRGYSTHLSVSWQPVRDRMLARRWAATFGAGLMLLLDDASSPGLLVRPRPGRLEFGGEHADGDRLAAAAAYAVGSTRALTRGGSVGRQIDDLALRVDLARAVERYGWYIDRRAFGPDLYGDGRRAELTTRLGSRRTAQQHLDAVLPLVLDGLAGIAGGEDLAPLLATVAGDRCLPCEVTADLEVVP